MRICDHCVCHDDIVTMSLELNGWPASPVRVQPNSYYRSLLELDLKFELIGIYDHNLKDHSKFKYWVYLYK